jgi:hypothetical protein
VRNIQHQFGFVRLDCLEELVAEAGDCLFIESHTLPLLLYFFLIGQLL